MPLPPDLTKFTTASPNLVSYDFQDIASGTGYIRYYLDNDKDSVGVGHNLTNQTNYATAIYHSLTCAGSGTTEETLTFDLSPFVLNQTIKGNCKFNMPLILNSVGNFLVPYFTVTVYHYDGSTETSLGTATSETWTLGAGATSAVINLNFTLTEKVFNVGDILRVKFYSHVGNSAVGTGAVRFGLDPANRTFTGFALTADFSNSNILIPFKTID